MPAIAAKPLQRVPFTGDDSRETLMVSVEFAPGATTGMHTHPGEEFTAVLEGTLELHAEGRDVRRGEPKLRPSDEVNRGTA